MKELIEIGLVIGGCSLVVLCIASFWIPKVLQWREKLAVLTPLMREMWWTYSIYVWSSHVFFAVLSLGFSDWLLGGSSSAMAMSTFILLWWSVRLYLQFFGFDLTEVKVNTANRLAKHLLTLLFVCLVILFATVLFWNVVLLPRGGVL